MPIIPLPYKLAAIALWSAFMVYGGWHEATIRQQARERDTAIAYAEQIKVEMARGDKIALELAQKETQIQDERTERMKHVKTVTTGRPCLSAPAVSLLNDTGKNGLPETASNITTEDAGTLTASDTDVEEWAINAQSTYSTCATRLNALIGWHVNR